MNHIRRADILCIVLREEVPCVRWVVPPLRIAGCEKNQVRALNGSTRVCTRHLAGAAVVCIHIVAAGDVVGIGVGRRADEHLAGVIDDAQALLLFAESRVAVAIASAVEVGLAGRRHADGAITGVGAVKPLLERTSVDGEVIASVGAHIAEFITARERAAVDGDGSRDGLFAGAGSVNREAVVLVRNVCAQRACRPVEHAVAGEHAAVEDDRLRAGVPAVGGIDAAAVRGHADAAGVRRGGVHGEVAVRRDAEHVCRRRDGVRGEVERHGVRDGDFALRERDVAAQRHSAAVCDGRAQLRLGRDGGSPHVARADKREGEGGELRRKGTNYVL